MGENEKIVHGCVCDFCKLTEAKAEIERLKKERDEAWQAESGAERELDEERALRLSNEAALARVYEWKERELDKCHLDTGPIVELDKMLGSHPSPIAVVEGIIADNQFPLGKNDAFIITTGHKNGFSTEHVIEVTAVVFARESEAGDGVSIRNRAR